MRLEPHLAERDEAAKIQRFSRSLFTFGERAEGCEDWHVPTSPDYTTPELVHSALVLIDVQNDFIDGAAPVEGTAERVETIARLAAVFRAAGRPIVHVVRLYVPGGSDVDLPRRAAIEAGRQVTAIPTWPRSPNRFFRAQVLTSTSDCCSPGESSTLGRTR
jgi:hypothetical protein